jgi:hypothetical protein
MGTSENANGDCRNENRKGMKGQVVAPSELPRASVCFFRVFICLLGVNEHAVWL